MDSYNLSVDEWKWMAYFMNQLLTGDCEPGSFVYNRFSNICYSILSSTICGEDAFEVFGGLEIMDFGLILNENITRLNNRTGIVNLMVELGDNYDNPDFSTVDATDNMKTLFTYLFTEGETEQQIRELVKKLYLPGNEMEIFFRDVVSRIKDVAAISYREKINNCDEAYPYYCPPDEEEEEEEIPFYYCFINKILLMSPHLEELCE